MLSDKIYFSFDITTDKVRLEILYNKKTNFIESALKECIEAFKPYEYREKTKIGFNLFMNNGGPYLHFNEIPDKYIISIEDNYNDDFVEENKHIINDFLFVSTTLIPPLYSHYLFNNRSASVIMHIAINKHYELNRIVCV